MSMHEILHYFCNTKIKTLNNILNTENMPPFGEKLLFFFSKFFKFNLIFFASFVKQLRNSF